MIFCDSVTVSVIVIGNTCEENIKVDIEIMAPDYFDICESFLYSSTQLKLPQNLITSVILFFKHTILKLQFV